MDNGIGTLVTGKIQLLYFNILPKQNFTENFSKLTHSPKIENDFYMIKLIWNASPTAAYVCVVRPNWCGLGYHCNMRECLSNWETIVTQIEKQIDYQFSFNNDSGGSTNKE